VTKPRADWAQSQVRFLFSMRLLSLSMLMV